MAKYAYFLNLLSSSTVVHTAHRVFIAKMTIRNIENSCWSLKYSDRKALPFRLASLGEPLNFLGGGARDFRPQFWAF